MRLLSWNINGFKAIQDKGFPVWMSESDADIIALQETKLQPGFETKYTLPDAWDGLWSSSEVKKGYSGVATFFRKPPLKYSFELPEPEYKGEGRLICTEHPEFFFFNVYFPNGQMGDHRLIYKLGFYDSFLTYAEELRSRKPIVVCGDFNTAHKEIDLKNPKNNQKTSGFLPEERAWMDKFVQAGYIDTFRMFESGGGHYSWWRYQGGARARNAGWRIDYFFVSKELEPKVKSAWIDSQIMGSDHCPVGLELDCQP